jgi:hypothetical protein
MIAIDAFVYCDESVECAEGRFQQASFLQSSPALLRNSLDLVPA